MKGKTITLLVAACFILLSFSPMSSNAEENLQSVLVEVNGEKYPVELSEEDLETIDEIIFSLQNQLQDVTDKGQATQHLQDALTALDNLGVLQGISVEQLTQQIMRGVLIADNENSILFQNQLSENNSTINATCSLITGHFIVSHEDAFLAASTTVRVILIILSLIIAPFAGIAAIPFLLLDYIMDYFDLYGNQFLRQLWDYLYDFAFFFVGLIFIAAMYSVYYLSIRTGLLLPFLNPHIIDTLTFGYTESHGSVQRWYPSGVISSIGLSKQTINGEFKGDLPKHFVYASTPQYPIYKWLSGIYGFTGISLKSGDNYHIIGSGLMTRLVGV